MPNYIVKYKDTITKYDNTNAGLFPPGLSIVCDKHGVVHLYVLEYPGLQCRYNMGNPVVFKVVMHEFVTELMAQVLLSPGDDIIFEKANFYIDLFSAIINTGTTLDKDLQFLMYTLLGFCKEFLDVITRYSERDVDELMLRYKCLIK